MILFKDHYWQSEPEQRHISRPGAPVSLVRRRPFLHCGQTPVSGLFLPTDSGPRMEPVDSMVGGGRGRVALRMTNVNLGRKPWDWNVTRRRKKSGSTGITSDRGQSWSWSDGFLPWWVWLRGESSSQAYIEMPRGWKLQRLSRFFPEKNFMSFIYADRCIFGP